MKREANGINLESLGVLLGYRREMSETGFISISKREAEALEEAIRLICSASPSLDSQNAEKDSR
jgi:hypothetical protein